MNIVIDDFPKGHQLRLLRVARGLRLWDVAVALGVQPARISEVERGVCTTSDLTRRIEEYLTS